MTFDTLLNAYRKKKWGINEKAKNGKTLLHLAVLENRSEIIHSLLEEGAVNLPDQWGLTPEHLSKILGQRNPLNQVEERPIQIYRNRDEKIHQMPLQEFEKRLEIKWTDTLLFQNPKIIYQIAKKCARKMKKTKLRQMNHWTLCLHEKGMGLPREHLYYIRWINPYLGYGVFAAETIPANTFIGEYTGVVKQRKNRKNRFNDYIFSYDLCGKATRWCIDAKEKGNFTRFLNHSDTPNLTSRWVIRDGITHIILFSNQCIQKGTQMTYCYGPWYWRSRSAPSPL